MLAVMVSGFILSQRCRNVIGKLGVDGTIFDDMATALHVAAALRLFFSREVSACMSVWFRHSIKDPLTLVFLKTFFRDRHLNCRAGSRAATSNSLGVNNDFASGEACSHALLVRVAVDRKAHETA